MQTSAHGGWYGPGALVLSPSDMVVLSEGIRWCEIKEGRAVSRYQI